MRDLLRWSSGVAFVLTLVIWVANLGVYTGMTIGQDYAWRLEHGRLEVARRPGFYTNPRGFYLAPNSESPRWSFEGTNAGSGRWEVVVPLWAPLVFFALVFAGAGLVRRPDDRA